MPAIGPNMSADLFLRHTEGWNLISVPCWDMQVKRKGPCNVVVVAVVVVVVDGMHSKSSSGVTKSINGELGMSHSTLRPFPLDGGAVASSDAFAPKELPTIANSNVTAAAGNSDSHGCHSLQVGPVGEEHRIIRGRHS